jgi:hypothetical protein
MGERIELACINAEPIVIVSARRVHTVTLSEHGGKWNDTSFYFKTDGGVELEIDTYDMLYFGGFRGEVAVKTFRVLDEPFPERWLQIVAGLLVMLQAAPLEEVVKDEREKVDPQEELKAA